MSNLTPDQEKALNYKKHIAVTANAGSGKTFVLSKRFVEIALDKKNKVNSIVAITFTDKAAGELYTKINKEINERIVSAKNDEELRTLERIRRQLISANISTIHSFCINLLKEFSPEANLDANFTPIDQETAEEISVFAIEETINNNLLDSDDSENLKELIRLFGSKSNLIEQLKIILAKRKLLESGNDILQNESKYYENLFESEFNELFSGKIKNVYEAASSINSKVLENDPRNERAVEAADLLKNMHETGSREINHINKILSVVLTDKGKLRQKGYLNKKEFPNLPGEIQTLEETFSWIKFFDIPESYDEALKKMIELKSKLLSFYRLVEDKYEELKFEEGYLDFEDILLFTKRILSNEHVLKKLSEKYKYIMIDEFQDTDDLQYKIFMPILSYLEKGNLFVVGDEKQSIYMFRDADLEVFENTKEQFMHTPDQSEVITLPHSFRMYPQVAAFVNALFDKLFAETNPRFNEVKPQKLICTKAVENEGCVEFLLTGKESEITEGDLVAKKIIELKQNEKEISLKNIAVLCRKRSSFKGLEESFLKYKIPFSIIGGQGYYQKQIIFDVHNYISFLINPKNDLALVGILRSPFFAISDANLFEISLLNGGAFFDKLTEFSSKDEYFQKIVDTLNAHIAIAFKTDIPELLNRILKDTFYWAVIASKTNSEQEIANLKKLVDISINYSGQSFKNLFDFAQYIKTAIDTIDDEGQAALINEEDSVKIMTIHQSKGLEFEAVFVFNCNQSMRDPRIRSKQVAVDKKYGLLFKVPQNSYFEDYVSPPVVCLYNYINYRKNLAESKRLLYVALTRAVKYLYVSADLSKSVKENSFIENIITSLGFNNEENFYEFNYDLEFWENDGGQGVSNTKEISFNIPITKNITVDSSEIAETAGEEESPKEILLDKIKHSESTEFISATKVVMFSQCPVKYKLTYDLGYSKYLEVINNKFSGFDFETEEPDEDEIQIAADVKGRIIHKILEKNFDKENYKNEVITLLENEYQFESKNVSENSIEEISGILDKYFSSNIYNELSRFSLVKNEYEIYSMINDFYLYGIIDKIIFDDDKILIVDYKTDNIKVDEINERAENYLPQLKFYSLLAASMNKKVNEIHCKLIFLNHPDNYFEAKFNREELTGFKDEIKNMVNKIRSKDYTPVLEHCKKCHYSDKKNNCVMN
ncbi:MAG: UvrD-helicase domain-containing protein [Ignavibacteria bacterium]|jgi:ATP-dependent helicase/nuclease subunit A